VAAEPEQQEFQLDLVLEAGKVFTPTAPIDEKSLFAGRREQILDVLDAVNQKGQHAIIFGERGVGKTSLANVLSAFLARPRSIVLSPRVNCDSMDTFESVWRKVLDEVQMNQTIKTAGLVPGSVEKSYPSTDLLSEGPVGPDSVRRILTVLAQNSLPILIIDEFDRLDRTTKRAFADLIKNLSDHAVGATVVLVGVADSVEELIEEHRSVERALVQIRMLRMSNTEIAEIVDTGARRLTLTVQPDASQRICTLSQGLPYYAHLLGLHSSRVALEASAPKITVSAVDIAISKAILGVNESIRRDYHDATSSARKDNLFSDVLLACALAHSDDFDFFAAQHVREALRAVTGKPYEIWSFAQHLNDFCDPKRGSILRKSGAKRKFRYRFDNPLMQPFVIMKGLESRRITPELLRTQRQRA
jgi:Cdc6-like AAA superfamily ATPase